jgi:hypothetical protein
MGSVFRNYYVNDFEGADVRSRCSSRGAFYRKGPEDHRYTYVAHNSVDVPAAHAGDIHLITGPEHHAGFYVFPAAKFTEPRGGLKSGKAYKGIGEVAEE